MTWTSAFDSLSSSGSFNESSNAQRPQVYVVGGIGSGKSQLVASVMGHAPEVLQTGSVGQHDYTGHAYPRIVFIEIVTSLETQSIGHMLKVLHACTEAGGVVWYCIDRRLSVQDHAEIVERLLSTPLALALVCTHEDVTQPKDKAHLFREVAARFPGLPCFFTGMKSDAKQLHRGILKLADWSIVHFQQENSLIFRKAQRKQLNERVSQSLQCVGLHTSFAFGMGGVPVPFADAPMLIANQLCMSTRLSSIWDISELRTLGSGGFLSLLATQIGRSVGRSLMGNLLKLVPGLGTAAGCAVNALVAATITGSIGFALHQACVQCAQERLENRDFSLRAYLESDEGKAAMQRHASQVATEYAKKIRPQVPSFLQETVGLFFSGTEERLALEDLMDIQPQTLHCCGVDVALLEKMGDTSCCHIFIHGFSAITSKESATELMSRVSATKGGTSVLLHWECGDLSGALSSFDANAKDVFRQALQRVETLSYLFDFLIEKALRGRQYDHINIIGHSLGARMAVLGLQRRGEHLPAPLRHVLLMGGCVPWPEGGLPVLQHHGARCYNCYNPDFRFLGLSIPRDLALAANPFDDQCIGRVAIVEPTQPVFNVRCENVGHNYWPHVHSLMEHMGMMGEHCLEKEGAWYAT